MDCVRSRQLESHLKNKKLFDSKLQRLELKKGDFVFLYTPIHTTETGKSKKLAEYQTGPYLVKELVGDNRARIAKRVKVKDGKPKITTDVVSIDRLTKATKWSLSKSRTSLSWPIAKRFKILRPGPRVSLDESENELPQIIPTSFLPSRGIASAESQSMPLRRFDFARNETIDDEIPDAASILEERDEGMPFLPSSTPIEDRSDLTDKDVSMHPLPMLEQKETRKRMRSESTTVSFPNEKKDRIFSPETTMSNENVQEAPVGSGEGRSGEEQMPSLPFSPSSAPQEQAVPQTEPTFLRKFMEILKK